MLNLIHLFYLNILDNSFTFELIDFKHLKLFYHSNNLYFVISIIILYSIFVLQLKLFPTIISIIHILSTPIEIRIYLLRLMHIFVLILHIFIIIFYNLIKFEVLTSITIIIFSLLIKVHSYLYYFVNPML